MKILINSSPRSAHAWLQYVLWYANNFDRSIELGELYSDKMITRTNNPIALYGKFKEIKQVTILRNPIDIIPSIMAKAYGGLGQTTIAGITMPSENNVIPDIKRMALHQIEIYERWATAIADNADDLYAFTFEQATEDVSFVTKSLLDVEVSNDMIPDILTKAKDGITKHDKGHLGFNNPIPVSEKPSVYYESREALLLEPRLESAIQMYGAVKDIVLKSQSDWNGRG